MRTISALGTILLFSLASFTAAADDLNISPTNSISASGLPGGPFILGTTNLILTNTGPATINWSLASTANWLSASPSNGSLDPGGLATTVTVSVASAASSLPFGNYQANLWFTNLNNSVTQSVPASLTVTLVQNGGFETGDFTDWTMTNDAIFNLVTNAAYPFAPFPPRSGSYFALLGESGGLAYLTQTIPTVPGQRYQISFWVNCDTETPNEFLFNWNGQTFFDSALTNNNQGTNFIPNVWSNFQFTATATTNTTVIEFGAENDNSYFGLDDVSVQPFVVPPLTFQSITKSGSSLQLTWNSSSGTVYQLQYATNLAGANWSNIGNSITAATTSASASTPMTSDQQRFYRVEQLP